MTTERKPAMGEGEVRAIPVALMRVRADGTREASTDITTQAAWYRSMRENDCVSPLYSAADYQQAIRERDEAQLNLSSLEQSHYFCEGYAEQLKSEARAWRTKAETAERERDNFNAECDEWERKFIGTICERDEAQARAETAKTNWTDWKEAHNSIVERWESAETRITAAITDLRARIEATSIPTKRQAYEEILTILEQENPDDST